MIGVVPRLLRVTFSKAESGQDYVQVAQGTWLPGSEPVLRGEPIPPEVLKGLEVQVCATSDTKGTLTYDRADVRYALEFDVMP
jgi:hypothetical protein